jgi:hypothetical protein
MKQFNDMQHQDFIDSFPDVFTKTFSTGLNFDSIWIYPRLERDSRTKKMIEKKMINFGFHQANDRQSILDIHYDPKKNQAFCKSVKYIFIENMIYADIYHSNLKVICDVFKDYNMFPNVASTEDGTPHKIIIDNFFESSFRSGDKTSPMLIIKKDFEVNQRKVYFEFNMDGSINNISYYLDNMRKCKILNRKVFSPKRVVLKNMPLSDMAEICAYDLYLRSEYGIKRRNRKELDLIKMIRY